MSGLERGREPIKDLIVLSRDIIVAVSAVLVVAVKERWHKHQWLSEE